MFKRRIAALLAAVAIPLGGAALAASPAMAAACTPGPNCQTVNVSVNTSIAISGLQNVVFQGAVPGAIDQGCPATTDPGCATAGAGGSFDGTPSEQYTINSNDPNGYLLNTTAGTTAFLDGTGSLSPLTDAMWFIHLSQASLDYNPSTTQTTVFTSAPHISPAGGDQFTELWTLHIPASGLAAGSYNNSLLYFAQGK